jgi:hypothetical protein
MGQRRPSDAHDSPERRRERFAMTITRVIVCGIARVIARALTIARRRLTIVSTSHRSRRRRATSDERRATSDDDDTSRNFDEALARRRRRRIEAPSSAVE